MLRGVDAVVFVADSERGKMDENKESLENLRDNLKDYDLDLDEIPFVIQYNKRDLDDTYTIEELEEALNPNGVPHYEATAMTGEGVFECFRGIGQVLLKKLSKEVKLDEKSSAADKLAEAQASAKVTLEPESAAPAQTEKSAPDATETVSTPAASAQADASNSSSSDDPEGNGGPGGGYPKPVPHSASSDRLEKLAASMNTKKADAVPGQHQPAASKEPAVTYPAESSWGESEKKSGNFLKRLFGRDKGKERSETPGKPGTVVAHIPGKNGDQEPVFLEKKVTVPITLSPEEVMRGATLRLVVEVEVSTEEDESRRVA